ncbi:hypothetical protein BDN72DRAFT_131401 [Pluteus cervinus]|uniref:Uncharacterized protein n=1 Tax=Pluteus cervinus TaxID=181527 RepID=A0ACD3AND0_9AGAR|nr:hypothetical protein BDN72DRAFT_131401 [Pluteus cervinus]
MTEEDLEAAREEEEKQKNKRPQRAAVKRAQEDKRLEAEEKAKASRSGQGSTGNARQKAPSAPKPKASKKKVQLETKEPTEQTTPRAAMNVADAGEVEEAPLPPPKRRGRPQKARVENGEEVLDVKAKGKGKEKEKASDEPKTGLLPKWTPLDLESHPLCEPSSSKATPATDNDQTSAAAKPGKSSGTKGAFKKATTDVPHESGGAVAEKIKDTLDVSPGDDNGPVPGSSKTTTSVEDSAGKEEPAVVTKAAKKEMVEVAIDGEKKKGKKKATEAPALPVDVDAASNKVEEKKTTKGGKSAGAKAVVKAPVENGAKDGTKGKGKGAQKKKNDTAASGPTPGVDETPVAGPSNIDINAGDGLQPEVKNKKRKRGEEEEEEPEPEQVESSKENMTGLRRSRRPKMPRKH